MSDRPNPSLPEDRPSVSLFGTSMYPKKERLDEKTKSSMIRWSNAVIVLILAVLLVLIVWGSKRTGLTVSFDTQGGSSISAQSVAYGESITEPEAPLKPGFVLTGWSISPDGSSLWDFETNTVTEAMTLYAVWEAQ